jgi:hypothetical protein
MDAEAGEIPARSRYCNRRLACRAGGKPDPAMAFCNPMGRSIPGSMKMSDSAIGSDVVSAPIPVREVLPWLIFGIVMLLAIYFVGAEEGATSIIKGMYVHEWVHDSRHLLGFPCH